MKVQDEARWLAQKAEIAQGEEVEVGKVFLEFLEDWCSTAEALLGSYLEEEPLDALRATLAGVETRRGHLSVNWLSQMLAVICSNWAYSGDQLFEDMTSFEKRLVIEAVGEMLGELQQSAEDLPSATIPASFGEKVPSSG